jgi:DNA polymerase-4
MTPSALRKILHIDMDAFFASVEQRDDPRLRGRPVAVGHGAARGVVAAASYEARAFGVRSAMASTTALALCPRLVFVKPRFEVYRAVSRQIHAIFADYADLIEPLSLDEAYLDITDNRRGLASASATAREIRARILSETGLTASAGVSYNKLLAKLASDYRKPDGQFVIPPGAGADFVAGLPVARFHGVGPVTAARMRGLGLVTGADLRNRDLAWLTAHFGKAGAWYHALARGEDERPVRPDRARKSSGSETTFARDLTSPEDIEAGVLAMAQDVWAWCARARAFGRTVAVKVKFADFRIVTRRRTVARDIADPDALRSLSRALVRTLLPVSQGVRLVGVTVSGFGAARAGPPAAQLALDLSRFSGPSRAPPYSLEASAA